MFWSNFWLICDIVFLILGGIMIVTGTITGGLIVSFGAGLQLYWREEAREKKEKERLEEIEKLQNFVDKTIKEFIENDSKN